MKSKGQVLVTFILILPVLFAILMLVIDMGTLEYQKRILNNSVKDTITYYFDDVKNNNEYKLKQLIKKNVDDVQIDITKTDTYVKIKATKKVKSTFSYLFNKAQYKIETIYEGNFIDGKLELTKG